MIQSFMQILVDTNCLHTKKLLADSWHDYILRASIFHASLTHVISQQKPPGDFWPLVWVCKAQSFQGRRVGTSCLPTKLKSKLQTLIGRKKRASQDKVFLLHISGLQTKKKQVASQAINSPFQIDQPPTSRNRQVALGLLWV